MNINDHREDIRGVLAGHFILWHPLNGPGEPGPRGEWRCDCGKKFGFSDTAISHQAEALLASPALARLLAAARDEARAEVAETIDSLALTLVSTDDGEGSALTAAVLQRAADIARGGAR